MYSINVKTAEPIGPKFCVEPHMTQGRFIDAQNFKKLSPNIYVFCKILKIHKK